MKHIFTLLFTLFTFFAISFSAYGSSSDHHYFKINNISLPKALYGDDELYFVEDYINAKEINRSKKFSPGWLTIMADLRPSGRTLGVSKVEIKIIKVKNENGDKIEEKLIDIIPFDVKPDWDYTFFRDKDKVGFKTAGTYTVILQTVDAVPICWGQIEIIL
ncbi:hypothetical protein BH10BAC5_BH10BAC5_25580 [soil metagenome]